MSNSKSAQSDLDLSALVEGLGQGILLFDGDDRLVLDNQAARAILGANFAPWSTPRGGRLAPCYWIPGN